MFEQALERRSGSTTSTGSGGGDVLSDALGDSLGDPLRRKKKRKGSGLPPEIEALKLRKVTVTVQQGAWEKLEPEERENVLEYLVKKDEYAKQSKFVKRYRIEITTRALEEQRDEQVASMEAESAENNATMATGSDSKRASGVIGVEQGKREVPIEVVEQDKPGAESYDIDSKFASARYKPEDMIDKAAFYAVLAEAAQDVLDMQQAYGEVGIDLRVDSGESQVPNPPGWPPGSLARARAETCREEARAYFESKGIDTTHIDFVAGEPVIGETPWDPKLGADAGVYTREQYLKLSLEMNGDPPPIVEEGEASTDLDVVELETRADVKHKGGNNFFDRKRHKRKKRGKRSGKPTRRRKKKKFRTIDCPKF